MHEITFFFLKRIFQRWKFYVFVYFCVTFEEINYVTDDESSFAVQLLMQIKLRLKYIIIILL